MLNRYSEHLFRDILVPVGSHPESWEALEQAICIAQKENANIHGLHTVAKQKELNDEQIAALQNQFNHICEQAGVRGMLAVEVGEPTRKILERAALTDLIVMKVAHPPSLGIKVIASNIRTLIMRSSRPMLAVPGRLSNLAHVLLAFDGSPKSQEALFVATYFVEQWQTKLSVLTAPDDKVAGHSAQDFARNYLEFNELEVGGVMAGDVPTFRIDHMPYGGAKDSGMGREGLRYAIEEMTEPKLLVMNLPDGK